MAVMHAPRHRWTRSFLPLLFALAIPALAAAPQETKPPSGAKTFTGETTVLNVEVPVQVLRDGKPVRGLQAENFRIYDETEPREIVGFDRVDLEQSSAASEGPEAAPVPTAARRHFLLLFDLDFSDKAYLVRSEEAAHELVEHGLAPQDLVAVAFFSGRRGVSSVLGFTPDRNQVLASLDRLARLLGQESAPGTHDREPEASGQDSLGLLAGGWDAIQPDIAAAASRERSLAEETLEWYGDGGGAGRGAGMQAETIADMADAGAEGQRQKRAARASSLVDALKALAEQTRYVEGQKHLLLFSMGFESTLYLTEGGGRVVARQGYFVPKPFSQMTPEERRHQSAELLLSGRPVQELGADLFAGPLAVDPETGTARVPTVIELGRYALLAEPGDQPVSLDVRAYAFDPQERVAGFLGQQVTVDRGKLAATPAGLKFFGELSLPAGSYDLRVLVRSLATGRVTLAREAVEVPAAGQGPSMLPPLFIQGPDERWLLMRAPPNLPSRRWASST